MKKFPDKKGAWPDIRRLLIYFMLLITIATGFNAFLSSLAFKNIYVNSTIARYNVIGDLLKKKIEISLNFGKKIESFFGMQLILQTNQRYLTLLNSGHQTQPDVHILISTHRGEILHTTEKNQDRVLLSSRVTESINALLADTSGSGNYFIKDGHYFIIFPINNWDRSLAAVQVIYFSEKIITEELSTMLKKSLIAWLWVLILSFAMLLLLFYLRLRKTLNMGASESTISILRTKEFSYSLFFIIAFCQILFSFSQLHKFSSHYLSINQDKAETLNLFIKDLAETLLKKGIDLKSMNQAELFLGNMISDIPEFKSIMIADAKADLIYYSDQELRLTYRSEKIRAIDLDRNQKYFRSMPLMNGDERAGTISILISEKALNNFLKKIFMDAATTVVLSIFFCIEIMILFFIGLQRKDLNRRVERDQISTRIIRPIAFIYFFAIDIIVSFIPLYMREIYSHCPIFFISEKISLGLPITVQMIFTAISILIVGGWCDKKGWQQPFLFGLFCSASGYMAAAVFKSSLLFLASLGVAGFGYGLSYIAAQNFVTTNSLPEKKAYGLSEYYAGCIAGSLCGIVTGGMVAEQIGFANVFFIGFAILTSLFVWVAIFMRPYFPQFDNLTIPKGSDKAVALLSFFKERQISYLIFLNIIPASIILVGFLNFFVPLYLQKNGISQSDIGRVFLIYSICLIYIAPSIIKRINTKKNSITYITIGSILVSMTLLTFSFCSGYTAVVISIIFLGLGASFNALRNAYILNLDISKRFGEGRATSLIFFLARLGQAAGPILFAWFTVAGNATSGIIRIGIFFLSLSIASLILNNFSTEETI